MPNGVDFLRPSQFHVAVHDGKQALHDRRMSFRGGSMQSGPSREISGVHIRPILGQNPNRLLMTNPAARVMAQSTGLDLIVPLW